jgi:hypothetical protein
MNRTPYIYILCAVLWLAVVGTGNGIMLRYENRPGSDGAVARSWPSGSEVLRDAAVPTLLLFVHPHCPCTRATINELAILMAHCQGKVCVRVLCFTPATFPENWEKTTVWQSASEIPGVEVSRDIDGVEARRFGAQTSGHAMLFDSKGSLLFSGGITGSRGHSGDNQGRSSIVRLLNGQSIERADSCVFGCSLLDPTER